MSIKKLLVALGIASAFALAPAAGSAAPLSAALVPGSNQFSDDDAEIVLKADPNAPGGYRALLPGETIGVGDILVGIVGITSFPTGALGTNANLYNEMTGVYAVQVATSAPSNPLQCNATNPMPSCSFFTFVAPTIGFNSTLTQVNTAYGTTVFDTFANTSTGTFAVILEDTTHDYSRTGTLDAGFDSATGGTERLVLNLNVFSTTAPANPADLLLTPPGGSGGSFNGTANISYQNFPGWQFLSPLQISGTLYNPTSGQFPIWSDSTYTVTARRVPEPGTLALLGLGLVAGTAFGLRRKA